MELRVRLLFYIGLVIFLVLGMSPTSLAEAARYAAVRQGTQVSTKLQHKPKATFELAVPFHKQEKSLSCEVASLRSALLYKGVTIPESELRDKLPKDETPKAGGIWGNPSEGFVGKVDGKMPSTGYGVHWDPIAKLANDYRPSEAFTNGDLNKILTELEQNNVVIIWGHIGPGKIIYWNRPGGDQIKAVLYEHTKIVIGYVGPRQNPTGIYVLDPVYGKVYQPTRTFLANWSKLDYSGVIVR